MLTVVQTILVFPAPILLALLLNSVMSPRIKRVVQSVLYLPHFLSWVVVVAVFQQVLGGGGLINTFLRQRGWQTLDIIGNPDLFIPLLTSQVMWKDTGWATILFLAALAGIDSSLYEASQVDGASRWRQLWHVTLPGLRGIIVLLLTAAQFRLFNAERRRAGHGQAHGPRTGLPGELIMWVLIVSELAVFGAALLIFLVLRLGDSLSVGFEQIILQQKAVGLDASEVIDTYVFNHGIAGGGWGEATAVGLVKGVIGTILVLGANKLAHIFGEQGVYQS